MRKTLLEPRRTRPSVLSPQSLMIGLPLLLVAGLIFGLLFSPLRTAQEKGTAPLFLADGPVTQSFVAEHPNLAKISIKFGGEAQSNTPLQVTLRRGSPDGSVISQSNDVGSHPPDNVQTYEFPVQPDSAGQTYFLTISPASSIGQPASNPAKLALLHSQNEVYLPGQLYINNKAAQGDLFFIAEYSSDPGELLKSFFEKQNQFGGAPGLALLCLFLTLVIAAVMLSLLARYYRRLGALFQGDKIRPWLIFGGLLLGLRLFLTLSFMLVTPPLQGPDEPGHIGRSVGMAEGKASDAYAGPVSDLMQRTRFVEHFPWLTYADDPQKLYPANAERLQLPFYYYFSSSFVRVGKLLGAEFAAQTYFARPGSALMALVTVAAGLGLGYLWRRDAPGLALAVPLGVALLPEAVHISSVTNNDNGAIAFGALAAWGMALLFMRGPRLPYFGIVLAGVALAIFSKASANALLPGYALGFYLLAWLHWRKRWVRRAMLIAPLAALILGAIALFVLTDHSRAASAWYLNPTVETARHAERTALTGAQSGQYALKLAPGEIPVEQQVNLFGRADFQRVKVTGWLKAANTESAATVRVQTANQTLSEQRFTATPDWTFFSFETDANAAEINHARVRAWLRLQFAATGNAPLYLDNLSMSPTDAPGVNLLANPSFEETVWTLKSDWQGQGRLVHSVPAEWLDAAQNGAALDYGNIFLQNCLFLFVTFWGAFGWSQVLFAAPVYLLGAVLLLLALVGLLRRKAWEFKPGGSAFMLFSLLTVLTTAFALQFIRLPTSWMYDGTPDITHSRHAFVTLLPQIFLLLAGLRGLRNFGTRTDKIAAKSEGNDIMPSAENISSGSNANFKENRRVWLGIWAWGTLLFFLSMLALLGTIFPYYYNN